MDTFSGWSSVPVDVTWQTSDVEPRFAVAWPLSTSTTWEDLSAEDALKAIGDLKDNWDGYGGASVDIRTLASARGVLSALTSRPDTIVPTAAGTLVFEWTGALGRASLELGIDSYSFYTAPRSGVSIFADGRLQDLDAEDIGIAAKALLGSDTSPSLASSHWRLGIEGWT